MKILKRILGYVTAGCMIFSVVSPFLVVQAEELNRLAGEPSEYSYIYYTVGEEQADSFQGYAFARDYNYADKAALDADADMAKTGTYYRVEDGKPVLYGESGMSDTTLTQNFPAEDTNGNVFPNEIFTVIRYSVSKKTGMALRLRGATQIVHSKDQFYIERGSGNLNVSSDIQSSLAGGDQIAIKGYRDERGAKYTASVWIANETKDSGYIVQEEGFVPKYPNASTKGNYVRLQHFKDGTAADLKEIWYSSEAYSKEEYLLRQAVQKGEAYMLQNGLERDANEMLKLSEDVESIKPETLGLDLGYSAVVTFDSGNTDIITNDGMIKYPTEDTAVTLTAKYALSGEDVDADNHFKTIQYSITVPGRGVVTNYAQDLADKLTWDSIGNGQPSTAVTGNLNLMTEFSDTTVPGATAEITWTVEEGATVIDVAGHVTRNTNADVAAKVKAILMVASDSSTAEKEFNFTVSKAETSSDGDDTLGQPSEYSYIYYTVGEEQADSFQGYAFARDYNYADKAALDADADMTKTGTYYRVEDGKPVLYGESGMSDTILTQNFPAEDTNGNVFPNEIFTVIRYSVSKKTGMALRLRGATQIVHSKDQFYIERGSGNLNVSSDIQSSLAGGDQIALKGFRNETVDKKYTASVWIANETKDSGYIVQEEGFVPKYPNASTKGNYVRLQHFKDGTASDLKEIWYSSEAYSKEEYLLRQAVQKGEAYMLQNGLVRGTDGVLSISEDAEYIKPETLGLDLGYSAVVTFDSGNTDIITNDGMIKYPTEDTVVTLTAKYALSGEGVVADNHFKTIQYTITVPGKEAPVSYAEELIKKLNWDDISNGQAENAVKENLTLMSSFGAPVVTEGEALAAWSVISGGEAFEINGTSGLVKRQAADAVVTIKVVLSFSETDIAEKEFVFTVPRTVSAQEQAQDIADSITWDSLSSEQPDAVMQGFRLPQSAVTSEGEDAQIVWSVAGGSVAVSVQGDSCVIVPQTAETAARLQAVVTVNGVSVTKPFAFTVIPIGEETEFVYYDVDFTKVGDTTVENSPYAQNIAAPVLSGTVGDAYAKFVDGKGFQFQTSGTNDADHLDVMIDAESLTDNKTDFLQLGTVNTTEISLEYMPNPQNGKDPKTNLEFRDADNNYLGRISLVKNKIGFGISTYLTAAETNTVPWTADGSFLALYNQSKKMRIDFRIDYDNVKNEVRLYARLPEYQGDKGYENYTLLLDRTFTIDTGAQQNVSRIKILSMGSNFANIQRIRSYTTIPGIRYGLEEKLGALDWLNGQEADFVTTNLNLSSEFGAYGAKLSWTVTPEGILDNTGRLLKEHLSTDDRFEVTVQPVVVLDNPKYAAAAPVLEPSTVIVTGYNQDNLAQNRRVTLSGAVAAEGSSIANLVDGNTAKAFVSGGAEESFEILVDLGSAKDVNRIKLWRDSDSNLSQYKISLSADKENWIESLQTEANTESDLHTFAEGAYRYIKVEVLSKTAANQPVILQELEAEYHPGDDFKAKTDIEKVTVPYSVVSADFELDAVGKEFGTAIIWTSDKPDILRIAENPSNGKYKVYYTQPDKNTPVVLVATAGGYSVQFTVTAKGKGGTGGTGGGSGGSGGSGGGGSSSGGSSVPYIMPENRASAEEIPTKGSRYFDDVTGSAEWAAEYIDTLYEKNIINGKGNSKFEPDAPVSRAEYIKMLVLSLGITPASQTEEIPFEDVPSGHWAYEYIAAAYKMGIVQGVSDTLFGTDELILRQDVAVMAQRALQATQTELKKVTDRINFADAAEIDGYAAECVAQMQEAGILSGQPDGRFCPKENTTRAESAKILCEMMK